MAVKSLSAEITENISQLKQLKAQDPANTQLSASLQELYDLLHKAQGKEWMEQVKEYQQAKQALDSAKKETQKALKGLSQVATVVTKVTDAAAKVIVALAIVL